MSADAQAKRIEHHARRKTREHGEWVVAMARFGYAAKGLLYLAVGGIAARAAFGADSPEGAKGATVELVEHPIGALLVGLIAAGLLGYAAWRLVRAIANPEHDQTGSRIYSVFTAIVHLVLLGSIVSVLMGSRDNGDSAAHWTARALAAPFGRWLVLAVGVSLISNGIWQVYKAVNAKLDDELDFNAMKEFVRIITVPVARAGMTARGVVFALIGGSLGLAALRSNPGEANGVQRALTEVAGKQHGQWMLAAIGVGFVAYGVYELIRATYRRVHTG
jgi:hypothetical protein